MILQRHMYLSAGSARASSCPSKPSNASKKYEYLGGDRSGVRLCPSEADPSHAPGLVVAVLGVDLARLHVELGLQQWRAVDGRRRCPRRGKSGLWGPVRQRDAAQVVLTRGAPWPGSGSCLRG